MTDTQIPEDCLDELHREHEVATHLIDRLESLANALDAGRSVSAAEVREGVDLLDRYLHHVHADRIDADLVPDAKKVAMAECFGHLSEIAAVHRRMREEEPTLERSIADYASGVTGAASVLAIVLLTATSRDREEMHYEEDYPLSCLPSALTATLSARVAAKFAGSQTDLQRLESEIDRYLARPERPAAIPA